MVYGCVMTLQQYFNYIAAVKFDIDKENQVLREKQKRKKKENHKSAAIHWKNFVT